MYILFLLSDVYYSGQSTVFTTWQVCRLNCISFYLISTSLSTIDKDISYSDLKSLLEKGSGFVVDVRTKEEVDRGRIPGSIHIPGERKDAQS